MSRLSNCNFVSAQLGFWIWGGEGVYFSHLVGACLDLPGEEVCSSERGLLVLALSRCITCAHAICAAHHVYAKVSDQGQVIGRDQSFSAAPEPCLSSSSGGS